VDGGIFDLYSAQDHFHRHIRKRLVASLRAPSSTCEYYLYVRRNGGRRVPRHKQSLLCQLAEEDVPNDPRCCPSCHNVSQ